jgi:hypothetical protein
MLALKYLLITGGLGMILVAELLSDKLQITMVPADGEFFFANDVLHSMSAATQASQAEQSEAQPQ